MLQDLWANFRIDDDDDDTIIARNISSIQSNPLHGFTTSSFSSDPVQPPQISAISSDPVQPAHISDIGSDLVQPAQISGISSDLVQAAQPSSDIVLLDHLPSSPPFTPDLTQAGAFQPSPKSSPPDRAPGFNEATIELPLTVKGDLAVEAGPEVIHEKRSGILACHEKHASAGSILLFENPNELDPSAIQSLAFDRQYQVEERFSDKLDGFTEFLRHRVANCAVCQLTGDDAYHHLPDCPKAGSLGTFIWKHEAISDYMDEAVAAICALIRILAPSHLQEVALWMDEDIPGSYLDYRRWCLLPDTFLGVPALKGYNVVLALKTLWEDGLIEVPWAFPE
ncbi:hypothetical protein TWF730_003081 [Orbilia blumenaviensis]|uniref:Uncharacterized protein n=1 Tax=Orbilia blumenaviensis TaxID=1796055 RepID=A0AAV9U6W5_9PEZI